MTRFVLVLALALVPVAATVQANTPGDLPKVRNGLIAVAAADRIRQNCDSIAPRMVRAFSYIKSLESYARSQGFSAAQIEGYVESDATKAELKGQARAYLVENGVDPAQPATYCIVGRTEIDRNSEIGRLLKMK